MTQSYNLSQLANNLNTAGQLDATDGLVGAVPTANGGTGLASYTAGDLLYASGTTTLAKLADVATGNALISGGVGVAPSYGKIDLTTHINGTLPVANGGTGNTLGTAVNVTGVVAVANGGTGNTTGTAVNVSGTVAIANGGTGATTATAAGSALGVLGNGQSWTSVTRTASITYTNSTGRPIYLNAWGVNSSNGHSLTLAVSGVTVCVSSAPASNEYSNVQAIIPAGASYILTTSGGGLTITAAAELR